MKELALSFKKQWVVDRHVRDPHTSTCTYFATTNKKFNLVRSKECLQWRIANNQVKTRFEFIELYKENKIVLQINNNNTLHVYRSFILFILGPWVM
jgi:hypothetical protein